MGTVAVLKHLTNDLKVLYSTTFCDEDAGAMLRPAGGLCRCTTAEEGRREEEGG